MQRSLTERQGVRSIAFPMRLGENGLLRREESVGSLLALLQVMARTPAGSWAGCPEFGLRDLFEDGRQRADLARVAMERTNRVLAELGIDEYRVAEVVREVSANRDIDTYSITIVRPGREESFTTTLAHQ